MSLTVYLEKPLAWAEPIATFESEAVYMRCVPALEAWAEAKGCIITESMDAEDWCQACEDGTCPDLSPTEEDAS